MTPSSQGSTPITVLIVDDVVETRETLKRLLSIEAGIRVIGMAASGEDAVRLAKELTPDVVLMDLAMPGIDGVAATEAILRQSPGAQVIMMSVQSGSEQLRRAMLAGAREYLSKPFTIESLVTAIRRLHQIAPHKAESAVITSGKRGKVITVYSPKGGTGCSTIAVNLAVCLQQDWQHKVVLVDSSLQFGDVAVLLNLKPTRTIADVVQRFEEMDGELLRGMLVPHPSGVKALLCPGRPELADLITPDHMKAILRQLMLMFDVVIVDTWSSLHDLVLAIMDISDRAVVVSTPDIPSVKSTRLFFDVAGALSYSEDRALLVVNRADVPGAISIRDIEESVRHRVAQKLPTDDRVAVQSANVGVPLVLTNRRSGLAKGIIDLAAQIQDQALTNRTPKDEGDETIR